MIRTIISFAFLLSIATIATAQIAMTTGSFDGVAGQTFRVPVSISNLPQQGLSTFNIQFTYDNRLIYIEGIDRSGSLTSNLSVSSNAFDGGQKRLRVIKSTGAAITNSGVLFYLVGRRINNGENASGLSVTSFNINNGATSLSFSPIRINILIGSKLQLSIPNQVSTTGSTIDIPVRIGSITSDYGAYSYQMEFGFNPNVFSYINLVTAGTLSGSSSSNSCLSLANLSSPGRLSIVVTCINPINGSTDLVRLRMQVKPDAPRNSTLQIVSFIFDSDSPPVITQNGSMTVSNGTNVSIDDDVTSVGQYELSGAYPNPFNPSTVVSINLPNSGFITLKAFDSNGREVKNLVQGYMTAGRHEIQWNAGSLPSGVYLIRLDAGGEVHTQKVTLVK